MPPYTPTYTDKYCPLATSRRLKLSPNLMFRDASLRILCFFIYSFFSGKTSYRISITVSYTNSDAIFGREPDYSSTLMTGLSFGCLQGKSAFSFTYFLLVGMLSMETFFIIYFI